MMRSGGLRAGADLSALAKEAAAIAVNRIFKTFLTSTPAATEADGGAEDAAGAVVKEEGEPRDGAAGVSSGTAAAAAQLGDGGMASERGEGGDVGEKKSVTDVGGGLRREALTVEELLPLALTMSDFEEAVERVQVSVCILCVRCCLMTFTRLSLGCMRLR